MVGRLVFRQYRMEITQTVKQFDLGMVTDFLARKIHRQGELNRKLAIRFELKPFDGWTTDNILGRGNSYPSWMGH